MLRPWPESVPSSRGLPGLAATLFIGAVLLQSTAGQALPNQVLLLRHGHKTGELNHFNLSPEGFQRAIALATLLPACFGNPTHIVSYYFDPITSKNSRSYQTLVPLAIATGVNIAIDHDSPTSSLQSGKTILRDPHYDGANLVIAWEHRRLPLLAEGLGVPGLAQLADDDFDPLVLLRYRQRGLPPEVRQFSQRDLVSGRHTCAEPPMPAAVPPAPSR